MPRQIRAAVSPGNGALPELETLWLDDPLPDELVIAVRAAAICHTDIGISEWAETPRVYGHEGAGIVVETGSGVKGFRVGDRVAATFGLCGKCRNCIDDHPAYCFENIVLNIEGQRPRPALTRPDGTEIGGAFFQQSSFATHALVTERNIVRIPDDLDFVTAAPLGCGIQTGAGAVINNFAAKPGRPLLVIGCGAVGLAAVMAGKIAGCAPIIASDVQADRLELAAKYGADVTVSGEDPAFVGKVLETSQGGVSYALDSAGTQQTFEAAIACLHPGGNLGILTLPGGFEDPVPHPGGLPFMTTSMTGIIEGDSVPDRFIPWLIEQHRAGKMPYDELITTYPFEDIAKAFAAQKSGDAIKPVLTFESEVQ
ncbi:NAD(P)-dependent alcohol dehydrogenase [Parasphingorhabdus marina]|uniref:NAD(P)-dependent alcohol dehydrogenase n=1 Tax=Parasphingorhabdus marina TaxID=394732 RepID=UPI0013566300|nr:NAD(P)-dependent alcohol dehydrogenase [Parasphingorhabdus marina]